MTGSLSHLITHDETHEHYWTNFKLKSDPLPLIVRTAGSHIEHTFILPTGFPEYQILLTLNGTGELITENGIYRLSEGSVLFFAPYTPLHYQSMGNGSWDTLWVTFNTELPLSVFTDKAPGLYRCCGTKLGALLAEIRDLPIENRTARASALLYKLLLSLPFLLTAYDTPAENHERQGLELARDYIHIHYKEKVTVNQLAAMAHMPQSDFSRAFSRMYGMPPHKYIQKNRYTVICEYLKRSGDATFAEIADTFGFSHPSRFYAFLQKCHANSKNAHFSSPNRFRNYLQNLQNLQKDEDKK